jgi:hypothetical protein
MAGHWSPSEPVIALIDFVGTIHEARRTAKCFKSPKRDALHGASRKNPDTCTANQL